MRAVVQRVRHASVTVDGVVVGEVETGFLVLLGIAPNDGQSEVTWLAKKIAGLRVFPDDLGRMNRSLLDCGYGALVVSQFTLYGDCRKGRRPSFNGAAPPEIANPLYQKFCQALRALGIAVSHGMFGARMDVQLLNDGPVTLVIDTPAS